MSSRRAIGLVSALALTGVLVGPGGASASIGTGVGAAPLALSSPAHAGKSYTFHWLYVKDTGTQASNYIVRAQRISSGPEKAIPASWIQLAPARFHLSPRVIKRVTVTVDVPRSAASGTYMTDLVASTYARHRAGAAALGAAAADKLSFTIPSTSSFPWIVVAIAGGILLLLALWYGLRRSGVRLRFDRTRAAA